MTINFSNWFDSVWGSAIYSTNAEKNKLIKAIANDYHGNVYEIELYNYESGQTTVLANFNIVFDASVIVGQKGVESIVIDETEIVF